MRRLAPLVSFLLLLGLGGCTAEKQAARSSIVLGPTETQAQESGCLLSGVVRDVQGAPIEAATLMVTGRKMVGFRGTATDTNGQFTIHLPETGGPFELKFQAYPFKQAVLPRFSCPAGSHCSVQVTLAPCGPGCTEGWITESPPIIDQRSTSD